MCVATEGEEKKRVWPRPLGLEPTTHGTETKKEKKNILVLFSASLRPDAE